MIATYSEAHRQLNRVLDCFLFGSVAEVLIGTLQGNWVFVIVWVTAALMAGLFRAPVDQSAITSAIVPTDNEFAHQKAFARKFLKLTNLLAATILVAGFTLGYPWWFNLLSAIAIWFTSMFGILASHRRTKSAHLRWLVCR